MASGGETGYESDQGSDMSVEQSLMDNEIYVYPEIPREVGTDTNKRVSFREAPYYANELSTSEFQNQQYDNVPQYETYQFTDMRCAPVNPGSDPRRLVNNLRSREINEASLYRTPEHRQE